MLLLLCSSLRDAGAVDVAFSFGHLLVSWLGLLRSCVLLGFNYAFCLRWSYLHLRCCSLQFAMLLCVCFYFVLFFNGGRRADEHPARRAAARPWEYNKK